MDNIKATILWFVILFFLLAVTKLFLHSIPWLAKKTLAGERNRLPALDGLRGVLAVSVLIQHMLVDQFMGADRSQEGKAAHHFIMQLGVIPVGIFFMISAYLFGGRILRTNGQLATWPFLYGRFMRIVPLYLLAVCFVALISFAVYDFRLMVPLKTLALEMARHLSFNFVPTLSINGFAAAHDLMGPGWTLHYEWAFYLLIPLLAFFYRRTNLAVFLYAPLFLIAYFRYPFIYFFIAGIASAQLSSFNGPRATRLWFVCGVVALIVAMAKPFSADLLFEPFGAYLWVDALLLVPTLVAVLQGGRWVAFLGSVPFRYLGEMSFSIYLLHMPLIYCFRAITGIQSQDLSVPAFIGTSLLFGIGIIAVSTLTFLFVEKPLMHAKPRSGKRAS